MTEVQYSAEFDTLDAPTISPLAGESSPEVVNAQVKAVLSDVGKPPEISAPADCVVDLPSGGTAIVRELTGADEEALAKINRVTHTAKFMATLLERGVENLNDEPATAQGLKNLLLGDREALILAIRVATFGKTLEFKDYICTGENCGESLDVEVDISTIPSGTVSGAPFEVSLWKGGEVEVRLPNGHDQEAIFDPKKTPAEQNTALLTRCVSGLSEKEVRKLGVKDRRAILDEIIKRTGGPEYDKVTFTHELCGTEVPVLITAGDLFQDL